MEIGKRIVFLRNQKGWSQRELAQRIGMNISVYNRIELGDRPVKDLELVNLANVLDVTTDYLLGRTNMPNSDSKTELESLLQDTSTKDLFDDWKNMSEAQRSEAVRMIRYVLLNKDNNE